jgi:hypothetical protein
MPFGFETAGLLLPGLAAKADLGGLRLADNVWED